MRIAVLTFEGFNELDSFVASAMLNLPACTDSATKPWVEEAGVRVLDQPFVAHGNVATAGGCLASHYLAAWVIARLGGWSAGGKRRSLRRSRRPEAGICGACSRGRPAVFARAGTVVPDRQSAWLN